jgi:hypothetical protein
MEAAISAQPPVCQNQAIKTTSDHGKRTNMVSPIDALLQASFERGTFQTWTDRAGVELPICSEEPLGLDSKFCHILTVS